MSRAAVRNDSDRSPGLPGRLDRQTDLGPDKQVRQPKPSEIRSGFHYLIFRCLLSDTEDVSEDPFREGNYLASRNHGRHRPMNT